MLARSRPEGTRSRVRWRLIRAKRAKASPFSTNTHAKKRCQRRPSSCRRSLRRSEPRRAAHRFVVDLQVLLRLAALSESAVPYRPVVDIFSVTARAGFHRYHRSRVRGRSNLARPARPGVAGQQLAVHTERPMELAGDSQHPGGREGDVHLYLAP